MWCVSVFGILAATCTSLARGVLQKTPVGEFRDPGDQVGCVLPGRAAEVCGEVVAAIDRARSIVLSLSQAFQSDVIHSHGNHVPAAVRNGAVVMFWLPALFRKMPLPSSELKVQA